MASISATVIPSRKNRDNTYPIRIKITSANSTSFITTPYKISDMEEWVGCCVTKRSDSEEINRWLEETVTRYRKIVESLPSKKMSASEIKVFIEQVITQKAMSADFAAGLKEAVYQLQQEMIQLQEKADKLMSYLDLIK